MNRVSFNGITTLLSLQGNWIQQEGTFWKWKSISQLECVRRWRWEWKPLYKYMRKISHWSPAHHWPPTSGTILYAVPLFSGRQQLQASIAWPQLNNYSWKVANQVLSHATGSCCKKKTSEHDGMVYYVWMGGSYDGGVISVCIHYSVGFV